MIGIAKSGVFTHLHPFRKPIGKAVNILPCYVAMCLIPLLEMTIPIILQKPKPKVSIIIMDKLDFIVTIKV